ncbi:glycosyltransferase [Algoriphagus aestuariicola]|uniref:Glycosyltransferase n=1 Tax=Algoriphagus aestuariicola TaxID=1852016 RepID=A0ABS3BWS0_9BACT|nr:glycosyltransferase [Algoriphagus aestuariicola]MBN7803527.1 glycosyltransferase [Algoriphagus aestuariicola]
MSAAVLGSFAGMLIVQYLLLRILLRVNWKQRSSRPIPFPRVSILIAARNEEKSLPKLLKSLDRLNYPADKLEILIADDQSEDATAGLIADWSKGRPNRRLISIGADQVGRFQSNGKANALAIVAKEAIGDLFFFTDADCEVPESWVKEGIGSFEDGIGIVIGVTQVKGPGFFAKMQELEWWNTLGIVKAVTDLGLPTTGLGNNMIISREAYFGSGGFEGIKSSVTEDLEISRSVLRAGYKLHQQVSSDFLVKTKAEEGWASLLSQRKRWVTGAATLSLAWKALMGIQFLFFPAVLALLLLEWKLGLAIWFLKVVCQSSFLRFFAHRAGEKIRLSPLIFFDFYQIASLSLTILYYFWPSKVHWKSRSYP